MRTILLVDLFDSLGACLASFVANAFVASVGLRLTPLWMMVACVVLIDFPSMAFIVFHSQFPGSL